MKRQTNDEPITRIGNCCGCKTYPTLLFKVPGVFRYRCGGCYAKEVGSRHWLDVEPERRCIDCGAVGELTGHMGCQYPGRFSEAS